MTIAQKTLFSTAELNAKAETAVERRIAPGISDTVENSR